MKKHIFSSILVAIAAILPASATNITLREPGTLADLLQSPESVTELVLAGSGNASDLAFVAAMPSLQTLDMSGLEILASKGVVSGSVSTHRDNEIPANMFAGAVFKKVTLPATPGLVIKDGAFAMSQLESITIPSTVASVGHGAFSGCENLGSAQVNAKALSTAVFSKCPSLESVVFMAPIDLPSDTFFGCNSLRTVSGTFTSIGDRAFSGCVGLSDFAFASPLKSIGREAFMGAGLTNVDLSSCSLNSIGEWAFAMMPSLVSLKLGNVGELGQAIAFACPKLASVNTSAVAEELPDFAYAKSGISDSSNLLPEGIERIGRYALSGVSGVEIITLPSTLAFIDDRGMENMAGLISIHASNLQTVPELGEDVWNGIEQDKVELVASNSMVDNFKSAEQWKNFRVVNTSSSADVVVGEVVSQLRGRFDGDDLIVDSQGIDIDNIMLFNPSGQLLISVEPSDSTVVINTTGFGTRIFIVNATLADGRNVSLKLARK